MDIGERLRRGLGVAALSALTLVLGACSSTSPGAAGTSSTVAAPPTTAGPNVAGPRPLAYIRSQYTAINAPTQLAIGNWAGGFETLGGGGTSAQMKEATEPAITALERAIGALDVLSKETTPAIAKAIDAVIASDARMEQGFVELVQGYGTKGFNLNSWGSSFLPAISSADDIANVLRKKLGLKPLSVSSS